MKLIYWSYYERPVNRFSINTFVQGLYYKVSSQKASYLYNVISTYLFIFVAINFGFILLFTYGGHLVNELIACKIKLILNIAINTHHNF